MELGSSLSELSKIFPQFNVSNILNAKFRVYFYRLNDIVSSNKVVFKNHFYFIVLN